MAEPFVVAIPLYPGVDLTDVAAPTEMFFTLNGNWDREVQIRHVAETPDPVVTRDGTRLLPHATFAELPRADLLWTPGGHPQALSWLMHASVGWPYLGYLRQIASEASWVTSVCEGALLLAQAGLLDGYRATTHWAFMDCLRKGFPDVTVVEEDHPRFVVDRNRVTGAGIAAGLDEALGIIQLLAGTKAAQAVQLFTQYFPRPPVTGPIPAVAPPCPVSPTPVGPWPWHPPVRVGPA